MTAAVAGFLATYRDPLLQTDQAGSVNLLLFVHNNAIDASPKNLRVAIALPSESGEELVVRGRISVDNASPRIISDTVRLVGDHPFRLEYVPGSAFFKKNYGEDQSYLRIVNTDHLPDSVATASGAEVDYQKAVERSSEWPDLGFFVGIEARVIPE
jgi:hypothetical protein